VPAAEPRVALAGVAGVRRSAAGAVGIARTAINAAIVSAV